MRTTRLRIVLLVALCAGFVAGQLSFSVDARRRAREARAELVEGTVRDAPVGVRHLEQLRELGYVEGTADPSPELRGVLLYDRERACPGLNLYSSRIRTEARLVDMEGREVHRWSHPGPDGWEHVELLGDGSLLVVVNEAEILKLDRDSQLLWRRETRAHHDLDVHPDGDIYALTHRRGLRPEIHPTIPVVEDLVEILGPDGELRSRISILDAMRRSPFAFVLVSPGALPSDRREGDIPHLDLLHTNHVQVLDGSLSDRSPLFARGHLLLSMRTVNAIAILDPEREVVVWMWGPNNLHRQHHPTLLPNGRILIFDNGRERSQIVEMDPLNREVAWRYAPELGFLSRFRGSVQRLENGNTLITESDTGHVFEVTPEGRKVWRFANPDVTADGVRIAIWRMERFAPGELAFLADSEAGAGRGRRRARMEDHHPPGLDGDTDRGPAATAGESFAT